MHFKTQLDDTQMTKFSYVRTSKSFLKPVGVNAFEHFFGERPISDILFPFQEDTALFVQVSASGLQGFFKGWWSPE